MSASYHHPILLIIIPLAFAVACSIAGTWRRRLCFPLSLAGALAALFLAWSLVGRSASRAPLLYNVSGWASPWGIQLRLDTAAVAAACLVSTAVALLVVYSYKPGIIDVREREQPALYALLLVLEAGMLGFVMSGDLFNMFLFFQVFSLSGCCLVSLKRAGGSLKASFRCLLYAVASSALFLLAIGLLYSVTGVLDMRRASLRLAALDPRYIPVAAIALLLFMLALGVQSAVFPFDGWLLEAAAKSISPVRVALCSLAILMAGFGMLRIIGNVYGRLLLDSGWGWSAARGGVAWAGVLSLLYFSLRAAWSSDIKRITVFSALSQVGLVVLAAGLSVFRMPANVIYCILAASSGGGCVLLAAGAMNETVDLGPSDWKGLGRSMPLAAVILLLGTLTVIGVPATAGYLAKKSVVDTSLGSGQWWFAAAVVLASALQVFYSMKMGYLLFARRSASTPPERKAPLTMLAPALGAAAASTAIWAAGCVITPALLASFSTMVR